ncbi:hypothetical protein P4V33_09390 [Brevibacillus borstelensis]|uniref:hypothetical protein n=1 Tax=Brevibacillus borstelensis TaxID=45462 RepID=UPI002E1E2711|nr:hypothetical protein [Brevibacillus borstelensis]
MSGLKCLHHVYECQDCLLSFGIEATVEDHSGIVCPEDRCRSENLRHVGLFELTLIQIAMEE